MAPVAGGIDSIAVVVGCVVEVEVEVEVDASTE